MSIGEINIVNNVLRGFQVSKRIALCLSGIMGGTAGRGGSGDMVDLKTIFNQYKKHILDLNDVDVFIHSWSTDVEDVITELYNPKKIIFEPQVDFREINKGKHKNPEASHRFYSRWNSIQKCVELKIKYEEENDFEYDIVMISRFDLLWFTDINFNDYDNKYFWVSNWNENGWPGKRGPYDKQTDAGNGFLDFWFFSNSSNIDKFSFLYTNLENGKFFKYHSSKRLSGHVMSKQFVELLEFDVKKTMYRGHDHEVYRRYNQHCGEKV